MHESYYSRLAKLETSHNFSSSHSTFPIIKPCILDTFIWDTRHLCYDAKTWFSCSFMELRSQNLSYYYRLIQRFCNHFCAYLAWQNCICSRRWWRHSVSKPTKMSHFEFSFMAATIQIGQIFFQPLWVLSSDICTVTKTSVLDASSYV